HEGPGMLRARPPEASRADEELGRLHELASNEVKERALARVLGRDHLERGPRSKNELRPRRRETEPATKPGEARCLPKGALERGVEVVRPELLRGERGAVEERSARERAILDELGGLFVRAAGRLP